MGERGTLRNRLNENTKDHVCLKRAKEAFKKGQNEAQGAPKGNHYRD